LTELRLQKTTVQSLKNVRKSIQPCLKLFSNSFPRIAWRGKQFVPHFPASNVKIHAHYLTILQDKKYSVSHQDRDIYTSNKSLVGSETFSAMLFKNVTPSLPSINL
jgi:hypothetical protein